MQYTKIKQIAKGWSSYIWLATDENGHEVILKEVREKSPRKNLYEREGKYSSLANSVGVGPQLLTINEKENFVVREYVDGPIFLKWIMNDKNEYLQPTREELYFFIKELYRQALALDSVHLSHNQLQVGKNIIVARKNVLKKGKLISMPFPVIIDFEKASIKPGTHTKNIGQLESFLLRNPNGAVAKKVREILQVTLE